MLEVAYAGQAEFLSTTVTRIETRQGAMKKSDARTEIRDGVPTAISDQVGKLKEGLAARKEQLAALRESWGPVFERERRRAERIKAMERARGSEVDLRKVDELAMARLRDLGGSNARVFRPSAIIRYSGDIPDFPSKGAPISFPTKPEDIYQHFHVVNYSDSDDHFLESAAWTLFPVFGPLAAWLWSTHGWAETEWAQFDFSQNKCPEDGTFLVTAVVTGWGKYRLYSDDTWRYSREAEVRIHAQMAGVNPNYSGVETLLADGDDNIDVYNKDFAFMTELSGIKRMRAGDPIYAIPQVVLTCVTKGAAISELDLSPGVGAVACMGMTIEKVGPL